MVIKCLLFPEAADVYLIPDLIISLRSRAGLKVPRSAPSLELVFDGYDLPAFKWIFFENFRRFGGLHKLVPVWHSFYGLALEVDVLLWVKLRAQNRESFIAILRIRAEIKRLCEPEELPVELLLESFRLLLASLQELHGSV